ncbi:MAG: D-alanyl-D-alanine carboxypeptidase [Rhodospirillales bacterium]|nr:D-alanyl-D-alanine carboxypeptidase [Rhodospirillales bacterium]
MLKTVFQFTALVLGFITWGLQPALAADINQTPAKQAIIMDYETGMILYEKSADSQMPTSSMSKVMTMYLVFEALKNGQLSLDSKLPVSEKAWRKGGSKMFVEVGNEVAVEDLIRGVIVQSGNDATIVLAEGVAGTEEAFADALNIKAEKLGMANSHFMNASGWPDPDHYSTAKDLAIMAAAIIRDFPDYYHYYSEKEFTYNNIKQPNRNPLLYRNIGADGVKTGHTEIGGYGLIGSGERNGRRVVMVLNGLPDDKARAQEGARLLDWGLRSFDNMKLFAAGETVDHAKVAMGKTPEVSMVTEQDVIISLPKTVKNDLKVEAVYEGPLKAPIKKGDRIGTLRVHVPRVSDFELPLVAGENVEPMGFFAAALAKARIKLSGASVE